MQHGAVLAMLAPSILKTSDESQEQHRAVGADCRPDLPPKEVLKKPESYKNNRCGIFFCNCHMLRRSCSNAAVHSDRQAWAWGIPREPTLNLHALDLQ